MENMLFSFQSIIIYVSLILGIIITLRSFYGFLAGGNYGPQDRIFALSFLLILYLQFITELYIFYTSTFNYEDSLKATEHIALILFATIMTQGGRLISIRSNDNTVKFRFRSIYYGLATGLLIYAYILVN